MKISDDEYCIRLVDLPTSVRALVAYDEDGFPTIIVNAHLSYNEQRRAVRHELKHIENDDAHQPTDLPTAECIAHLAENEI